MSELKKGGWKDSNWYVSFTGFWNEYKKHKVGLLGIVVLLLFIGMAVFAPWLATHDPSPTNKVAPSFLAPSWMAFFDPEGVGLMLPAGGTGATGVSPNCSEAASASRLFKERSRPSTSRALDPVGEWSC